MASPSEKVSILVVDDVPNTVEVLQRNLTAEGYTVFTAPGVPEAIRITESTPVGLVITQIIQYAVKRRRSSAGEDIGQPAIRTKDAASRKGRRSRHC